MKKFLVLIFIIAVSSCDLTTGTEGPPGPQGPPGADGADGILGSIFEVTVDFTPQNGYTNVIKYPNTIQVFPTDIVMAFLFNGVTNGEDIWTPLPQSFFVGNGRQVVYNYEHTISEIFLFLDGNTNLDDLSSSFTDDQTFRIAIIPALNASAFNGNLNNYEEVMDFMKKNPDFEVEGL